ncbi:hypothetical protein D9615_007803 [Tricholomella constricta]|uniref:Fungal lipase-type domain-containing protein n=1 Tax=Tricholomella constricta TaxID=117010 RepID=A0A8H5H538_9AGAR|nr:hypothetical protein D9615_007803 [Tricholomella constricta]
MCWIAMFIFMLREEAAVMRSLLSQKAFTTNALETEICADGGAKADVRLGKTHQFSVDLQSPCHSLISSYGLTSADRVSPEIETELAELGQFAEVAYSMVPLDFLFQNITTLLERDFPLEGYHTLQDAILVSSVEGSVGHLPSFVVYRPSIKQLVVAISGTSSVELALHDLRALKHRHPSQRGYAHSGFWALYKGIKSLLLDAIRKGLEGHEVTELAITGHSITARDA